MKKLFLLVMALTMVGCREKPQTLTLKEKAEGGDAEAQGMLGFEYETKQDLKEAVKWYRKAAEQGDSSTQVDLGLMYYEGRGVKQDFKEAIKWHQKAAEQGDAGGQFRLGFMYYNGKGVLEDDVNAYAWLNIAQANGSKNAKEGKDLIAKAKKMSPEQFAKAEELSKEMIKKNPKLIQKK